jgi:hypothetical protein
VAPGKLDGYRHPSDVVFQKAIDAALSGLGVNTTAVFLCDAAAPRMEATMRTARRTFHLSDEDDAAILRDRERRGEPVLRSGESMRVSMMDSRTAWLDDAMRSTYAAGERLGLHNKPSLHITDGGGDSSDGLRRPGYRLADGIQRDMSIYAAYDAEAEVAYKNVGAGERGALGQRVGDVCRFGPEGVRGHLKMIDGELTCVADRQEDAASFKDEREAAYAAKDEYYRNAWRGDGQ